MEVLVEAASEIPQGCFATRLSSSEFLQAVLCLGFARLGTYFTLTYYHISTNSPVKFSQHLCLLRLYVCFLALGYRHA